MKTLNEVIKALEWCVDDSHDDCDGCPYDTGEVTDCHDRNVDALYYLKEYQGYLIGKEFSEAFDEACTEMYNPPLTWDELKTMEGKPVWLEFLNDEGNWNGEWCLVESSDNLMCEILRC